MSSIRKELTSDDIKSYAKKILKSKKASLKFLIDSGIHNQDGSLADPYIPIEEGTKSIGFKPSKS